jgi:hypothetical protein
MMMSRRRGGKMVALTKASREIVAGIARRSQ